MRVCDFCIVPCQKRAIRYTFGKMQTNVQLKSIRQTGLEMGRLATTYKADVAPWASLSIGEFCEKIRAIPYRPDPPDREHVSRPYLTIHGYTDHFDCDDRAICVGAWAACRDWPFRFVAGGRPWAPMAHHVWCEVLPPGESEEGWLYADCTYPHHRVGCPEYWEHKAVIFDSRKDVSMPVLTTLEGDFVPLNGWWTDAKKAVASKAKDAVSYSSKVFSNASTDASKAFVTSTAAQVQATQAASAPLSPYVASGKESVPMWMVLAAAALGIYIVTSKPRKG